MKQNIQFLGVFAKNEAEAKETLLGLCKYSLNQLIQQFKDDICLEKMINDINKYKFPNSIHMTSLFVGNNQKLFKHQAYIDFKDNLEQNLVIDAIALSPNNIVTAITNHNYDIPLTNQYSHITTLLGTWKPKDSNKLLDCVFQQISYAELKEKVDQDKFWKIEPQKDLQIYVVQLKNKIIIPGVCKIH